ncbi:glucitol operon activator protein [Selenomonas sp. oral taxon 892 str. F0426]|uniref:transcriptional regulator GutM n=1 Tax=Selenomonas sp. oral taxon 892 TaxID=1321785 RepID=UPI0003AD535F|nr:transcriptional regulator GutM [Selenomonas sp. oral taxon 892]ERJ95337.1 glucitol operon activator protein [Selenomonas sp. oral taxon 892 str. F0426]
MQTEALLGGLFLLFVIQVIGTHLQVKEYKRAVREMHRLGNVGIGSRRRKLGPSNIVVIACNSDGEILDGRIMQGMTILSRFGPIKEIVGRTIYDLHEEYAALPEKRRVHYKGHLQALEALIIRLSQTTERAEEPVPEQQKDLHHHN